jgi:hypothetical protein
MCWFNYLIFSCFVLFVLLWDFAFMGLLHFYSGCLGTFVGNVLSLHSICKF